MFLTLSRDSLSSVSCPSLSMVTSQSKTRSSPRLSRSLFSGRIDHAQKREANTRDETPFAPDLELLAAASRHGYRSTPSLLVQPRRASWVRSLPAAVMTSSRSVSKFASVRRGFQHTENALRKRGNIHLFFSRRRAAETGKASNKERRDPGLTGAHYPAVRTWAQFRRIRPSVVCPTLLRLAFLVLTGEERHHVFG